MTEALMLLALVLLLVGAGLFAAARAWASVALCLGLACWVATATSLVG